MRLIMGLVLAALLAGCDALAYERYPKGLPKHEQSPCPASDPYGTYGGIECQAIAPVYKAK